MELIESIIKIMKSKGITAYKLEQETGIRQTTFQGWKKGSQPAADKILTLIQYLDVTPNELFGIDISKDTLTEHEKEIIEIMNRMDEEHQLRAIGLLENYADNHPKAIEQESSGREKSSGLKTG